MISHHHVEELREHVAEMERRLAGWKYLLAHAEQVDKAGAAERLPDPGVGAPWPVQAPKLWQPTESSSCACGEPRDPAKFHDRNHCTVLPREMGGPDVYPAAAPGEHLVIPGRDPYKVGTPVYDGTLPPEKENALGTIASEHDAYAQTAKARDEEQKWRQA